MRGGYLDEYEPTHVEVIGYKNGVQTYYFTTSLTDSYKQLTLNYFDIDKITFKGIGVGNLVFDDMIVNQAAVVPEPETYAMLLAGLGLVGFAARRKRQAA